jgi:hypothetical protein
MSFARETSRCSESINNSPHAKAAADGANE